MLYHWLKKTPFLHLTMIASTVKNVFIASNKIVMYVVMHSIEEKRITQTNKQKCSITLTSSCFAPFLTYWSIKTKERQFHNLLTLKSGLGPWVQSWFISPMVISPENFKCAQWVIMCSTSSAHRSCKHPLLPEEKLPYYSTVLPFHNRANVKCHL